MKRTVLIMMALAIGSAVMGQTSKRDMSAKTSESGKLVLDSIVTNTRDGEKESKKEYGYDSEKRKVYELSISYSKWTTPPYAPSYGDSIRYEYNQKGLLSKESTYRKKSSGDVSNYALNSYITYEYNEKDQLLKTTTYKYNDNIEDFVDNATSDYEYLEDGSLKAVINSARPGGAPWDTSIKPMKLSTKVEYSDFAGIDLPKKGNSYMYSAGSDGGEGTWSLSTYSISTYDDKNLLTKREFYHLDSKTKEWTVYSWDSYTYNDEGLLVYEEAAGVIDYNTNEMGVNDKTTYTYNADGYLETITGETYQSYKSAWVAKSSVTYCYSSGGSTSIRNAETSQNTEVCYNALTKEIRMQSEKTIGSISVYSLAGLKMISIPAVGSDRYVVKADNWEKGLYIVTLIVEGNVYNEKVYIYE